MIKEQAIVIGGNIETGRISVRVDRKSACETCQMKAGCGQKLINDGSQRKCIEFELDNDLNAKVGDQVTLAIPESSFIQASIVMYVLPLIFMIVGAVLGEKLFLFSDDGMFLLSSLGFIIGLLVARNFAKTKQSNPDFQPHIVAVDLGKNERG
jgi:sigma-E factor negative regulatory protein RseC